MKKSEALAKLAQLISSYDMGGENSKLSYDEAAQHLLAEIEKLGMSPPKRWYSGELPINFLVLPMSSRTWESE